MTFAERLRQLRNERGLTQEDLAEHLGISRSTIAGYEAPSKEREPSYGELSKIAAFFHTSIDYLLGKSDLRNPSAKLPEWVSQLPEDLREFFEKNPDKVGVYFRITKKAAEAKMDPETLEAFIETFRDARRRYKEDTGEDLKGGGHAGQKTSASQRGETPWARHPHQGSQLTRSGYCSTKSRHLTAKRW